VSQPRRLYVVRRKFFGKGGGSGPPNTDGRMIGLFRTREQAEAFQREAEEETARSGDYEPLFYEEGLEGLMRWSDFEPGVFRDWMSDHDIPDPATVVTKETEPYECPWYAWLKSLGKEQLARLYQAMHRFRFCEILEIPLVGEPLPEAEWNYPELHVPIDPPGLYASPPLSDEDDPN
jgi:hypothetical protein